MFDVLSPLQQVPMVSTIYQAVKGAVAPEGQASSGGLFGDLASAALNAAAEKYLGQGTAALAGSEASGAPAGSGAAAAPAEAAPDAAAPSRNPLEGLRLSEALDIYRLDLALAAFQAAAQAEQMR
ncbi:MAG: hypothetical protein HY812_14785 [Planctomycetes bacterium]|nr:hypothetical protein [Planctomycetota bacterium]